MQIARTCAHLSVLLSLACTALVLGQRRGCGQAHGINVNIVHSWLHIARTTLRFTDTALLRMTTPSPAHFVPVVLTSAVKPPQHSVPHSSAALAPAPTSASLTPHHIEVELNHGITTLKLLWPATACAQLGAWTREVLA